MKPYMVWVFIMLIVLLLVLVALISDALAIDERELVLPEPVSQVSYEALCEPVTPVAPQTYRDGLNILKSQQDVLNTAMEAISDELVAEAALLVWGEYSGSDYAQRTAPIWCACNRADAWGLTLEEVMHSDAFHGLLTDREVPEEWHDLARETLARWELEKMGYIDVGRTLPSEYLYFGGNGVVNVYRTEYIGGVEYVPEDGI